VTIRTKEQEVPGEFPPAKLFLNDIEEIVDILKELIESRELSKHLSPKNSN
jgi:hypothetical protein